MAFNYDPAQLADSEVMQVRHLIHDTDSSRTLYQDEEIEFTLSQEANIYMAAAMLCDQLVIGQARGVKQKRVGDLWITYDVGIYRQLSNQLRARGSGHQVPYAGGISVSDKGAQQANTDATKPSVFRRLHDSPEVKQSASQPPENPLTTI